MEGGLIFSRYCVVDCTLLSAGHFSAQVAADGSIGVFSDYLMDQVAYPLGLSPLEVMIDQSIYKVGVRRFQFPDMG